MNIFPFIASYPNLDLIASPDSFLESVSAEFINFKNAGFFSKNNSSSIFIYQIQGQHTYTGIIASNDIQDLEDDKILGHENTITEKEQEMLHLMLLRKAMIKPVLLAYEESEGINKFITKFISQNTPFFKIELTHDGEKHIVWEINRIADINTLQSLFKSDVPVSYIADGHHRASITTRLVKKKYLHDTDDHPGLLCAFFPFTDLIIYDYNRVVQFPAKMSPLKFIAKLSAFAKIKPISTPRKPSKKHEMSIYIANEWYLIHWKKSIINKYTAAGDALDVDLFNTYILTKIIGIDNIKDTNNVKYVAGVLGIEAVVSLCSNNISSFGCCLFPLSKEEVKSTAEAHGVLPPKSTWFEPRIRNGLIIKDF